MDLVQAKIRNLCTSFVPEDADPLVASFSGCWKMKMSLGKTLLQDPDLVLLDEPTHHVDLDTIEWLESYLKTQDVHMVIFFLFCPSVDMCLPAPWCRFQPSVDDICSRNLSTFLSFQEIPDPDLLLLDEPTNHVDLDTIEWLKSYLKTQDLHMVIICSFVI